MSKTENGVTTTHVYDAFGNLAAEYGSTTGSMCDTATRYLTQDRLGSLPTVADANGAVTRRYDYLPVYSLWDCPPGPSTACMPSRTRTLQHRCNRRRR